MLRMVSQMEHVHTHMNSFSKLSYNKNQPPKTHSKHQSLSNSPWQNRCGLTSGPVWMPPNLKFNRTRRLSATERCHQMLRDVIQAASTLHSTQRCYSLFLISLFTELFTHRSKAAVRYSQARTTLTESFSLSMSALLIVFARTRQNEGRGRQGPLLLKRYIRSITAC